MRITSGGNVLIGTTTDLGVRLLVAGDIATSTRIAVDTINGYTGGSTPITIQTGGAQAIVFGTNNTERMRITSGGNVGIGTSSPGERLQVQTSIRVEGSNPAYNLYETSVHRGNLQWQTTAGVVGIRLFNMDNSNLMFGTTATERMRITEPGNVLIGTTTDVGAKLYVNGGIRTANPTGSTSNDWLLGRALTSGTSSPDRWIRVQIGNLYYDILAVYMGSV
jgi:uncharacterized protein YaiE (UPF0345 family)